MNGREAQLDRKEYFRGRDLEGRRFKSTQW